MSTGIVVVSHSVALAQSAVDLAMQMVQSGPPRVELAAGTADGGIGTDAARVAEAIDSLSDCDGVLVFMDLGSAVLSAEMALEFTTSDTPVTLTSAPLVEGLVAGIVAAAGGAALDVVAQEARSALLPKSSQLGDDVEDAPPPVGEPATGAASVDVEVVNRDGLHARPAAQVVGVLAHRDVSLTVQNVSSGGAIADVTGTTALLAAGGRQGEKLRFTATGADAAPVLDDIATLFAAGFGEPTQAADVGSAQSVGTVSGPVVRMPAPIGEPAAGEVVPSPERDGEAARIQAAADAVAAALAGQAGSLSGEAQQILTAAAHLAADPALVRASGQLVQARGVTAARAVWEAYGAMAAQLAGLGGRMAERATDVLDARSRIVAELTAQSVPSVPELAWPSVLVAPDLAPADAASLNSAFCLAVVTEGGGDTSHASIILRALGIPLVTGADGAWTNPGGTTVTIDLASGRLTWLSST